MEVQQLSINNSNEADSLVLERSETTTHLKLRTSARVNKKMKLDLTEVVQNHVTFANSTASTSAVIDSKVKKDDRKQGIDPTKRSLNAKSVWSFEEKSLFFEALNECGKDIEAIHNYIVQKAKKRGKPENEIKTREQTRCYYYRTWMKISKNLTFSDDLKKVVQELYGLINYGELRKKLKCVKEKTYVKLNELIYRGTVKIQLKKKTIRVRTPMCPALRKLNALDDDKHEEFKLPQSITLELRPKNNHTWLTVQSLSQNPRIKSIVQLQYRLNSLLMFLNQKWNVNTKNLGASDLFDMSDKVLFVGPKCETAIDKPMVNISNYLSTSRVSLNAYEDRIGLKLRSESLWLQNQTANSTKKLIGAKRPRSDNTSDITKNFKKESLAVAANSVTDEEEPIPVQEAVDIAVNKILELKTDFSPEWEPEEGGPSIPANSRNCWSLSNSGSLCMGQLYLMFGVESRLEMEYWWEERKMLQEGSNDDKIEVDDEPVQENNESQLSVTSSNSFILKRLLSLAKLYYSKNKPSSLYNQAIKQPVKKNPARLMNQSTMFQKPAVPNQQFYSCEAIQAQLESLRNITPRFCRRGRVPKKQIVQRVLPLLPKFPENSHSLVQMKLVPKLSQSGEFTPVGSSSTLTTKRTTTYKNIASKAVLQSNDKNVQVPAVIAKDTPSTCNENGTNHSDLILLTAADVDRAVERNEDEILENEFEFFSNSILNSTPPSPSRMLKEGDTQWLNSEIGDFSFSSFLGQLESPVKVNQGTNVLNNEDTRFSVNDIESNYQCLIETPLESSMDFLPKFSIVSSQMDSEVFKKKF